MSADEPKPEDGVADVNFTFKDEPLFLPREHRLGGAPHSHRPSLVSAQIKRKVIENPIETITLLLALGTLLAQAILGVAEVALMNKQADIAASVGKSQINAALVQSYISSASLSGIADIKQRRMATVAVQTLKRLIASDASYKALETSLPLVTRKDYNVALQNAGTLSDKRDISSVYLALRDKSDAITSTGPYSIVLVSHKGPRAAMQSYDEAVQIARSANIAISPRVYRTKEDLYLVTLSAFNSRAEALASLGQIKQTVFPKPEVDLVHDPKLICDEDINACHQALLNLAG